MESQQLGQIRGQITQGAAGGFVTDRGAQIKLDRGQGGTCFSQIESVARIRARNKCPIMSLLAYC